MQLKIFSLEVGKFMYKYSKSQILAPFDDSTKLITNVHLLYTIRDKLKRSMLLYRNKHVQTQVRKY